MDRQAIRRPSLHEISRGLAVAALGLVLTTPAIAASAETPHYPQCGSEIFPSNHTILVVPKGSGRFAEYDLGINSGDCGNPEIPGISAIRRDIVGRRSMPRPDVVLDRPVTVDCFSGAESFEIQKTSATAGVDFEPSSGEVHPDGLGETMVKVHADLLSDGDSFLSGKVTCFTPERIPVSMRDQLNVAVTIRP